MGTPIVICFANVIRADMHKTTITMLMRFVHIQSQKRMSYDSCSIISQYF